MTIMLWMITTLVFGGDDGQHGSTSVYVALWSKPFCCTGVAESLDLLKVGSRVKWQETGEVTSIGCWSTEVSFGPHKLQHCEGCSCVDWRSSVSHA